MTALEQLAAVERCRRELEKMTREEAMRSVTMLWHFATGKPESPPSVDIEAALGRPSLTKTSGSGER